jgi:hypothetical protein
MCEPFQEMLLESPIHLHQVIDACEILALGWKCQKEAVLLKNEAGEEEEAVIHFRFQVSVHPEIVDPDEIER